MNSFFLSITNQIIMIILLFCLFQFIKCYKESTDMKITMKSSIDSLFKYLDKFYITNKWFTIISVLLYVLGNIGIIIFIRLINLSPKNELITLKVNTLQINYSSIIRMIISLILFIIILILYKLLLHKLFFIEVLKLHIYLSTNKHYAGLIGRLLLNSFFNETFGKFYLFFFNIVKKRNITNFIENSENIDMYCDIYDNPRILNFSLLCLNITEKNFMVYYLFNILKSIFGFLYFHIRLRGFVTYLPYIILFLSFFYDFLNLRIYYTYYIGIIIYLIINFLQILNFLHFTDKLIDHQLSDYFYNNAIPYYQQRKDLNKNILQYSDNFNKSEENVTILYNIKHLSLIKYLLNDMQKDYYNEKEKENMKNFNKMYRRSTILIIYIVMTCYLFMVKDSYIIMFTKYKVSISIMYPIIILLITLIYLSIKIFRVLTKNKEYSDTIITDYVHNKKYNKLFWIVAILQLYIFWILIVKANIMGVDQEVLWNMFNMEIRKIFTIEEKVAYFNNHLEFIITATDLKDYPIILESIKLFLSELNLKDVITEATTLKDIRISVEDLILDALTHYKNIITHTNTSQKILRSFWPYMDFITNFINLIVLWKFLVAYMDTYFITTTVPNIRILKLIHFFCISFVKYRYERGK